jgi:HEAT repeat protein
MCKLCVRMLTVLCWGLAGTAALSAIRADEPPLPPAVKGKGVTSPPKGKAGPPIPLPPRPGGTKKPAPVPLPATDDKRPVEAPPDGLPDFPTLLQQLQNADDDQQLDVIEKLQQFGHEASSAVEALVGSSGDENPVVRLSSLEALAGLGPMASKAEKQVRARVHDSPTESERVVAAQTLWSVGKSDEVAAEVLPIFTAALKSDDQRTFATAANALAQLGSSAEAPLLDATRDASPERRAIALSELGRMGARSAVPTMIKALDDKEEAVRAAAARALGRVGPAARPAAGRLAELLRSTDTDGVRANAAAALGHMADRSLVSVDALIASVSDPSAAVSSASIRALSELKADPQETIPLFVRSLSTEHPADAMSALAGIGAPAVPALIPAVKAPQSRLWAVLVLGEIGPEAKAAVPALAEVLESSPANIRVEILLTLGKIGSAAEAALPQIAPQLTAEQSALRMAATFAVGRIGVKTAEVESALKANLAGKDPLLKTLSAWAIARVNSDDPQAGAQALKTLIAALNVKDLPTQLAASQAMAELDLGPAIIPQLLPKLGTAFQSPDENLRANLVDLLAHVLDGKDTGPLLNAALDNPLLRELALRVIGSLGPQAKPAVPAIARGLQDERRDIRRAAATALAAVGPEAQSAVPDLTKALSDDDPILRRLSAYALGRIGPAAKSAVPALYPMLTQEDEKTGLITAAALAEISPQDAKVATVVIPRLLQELNSSEADDRAQATRALGQLKTNPAARTALEQAREDSDALVRAIADESLANR